MPIFAVLSYVATYFSLIIAAAVLLHDRRSGVHRIFATGMILCAAEELLRGFSYSALVPDQIAFWQGWVLVVAVTSQAIWLAFSVAYARVNSKVQLIKWKRELAAVAVLSVLFIIVFRGSLFAELIRFQGVSQWSIR